MTEYTDYTSWVAQSNMPEKEDGTVLNTVTFEKNGVPCMIDIYATDPMDAIAKVRRSHNE